VFLFHFNLLLAFQILWQIFYLESLKQILLFLAPVYELFLQVFVFMFY